MLGCLPADLVFTVEVIHTSSIRNRSNLFGSVRHSNSCIIFQYLDLQLNANVTVFLPIAVASLQLHVMLQELTHTKFRRDGNDLICAHHLPLAEALSGTTVSLSHVDGRPISVVIKEARKLSDSNIILSDREQL